MSQQDHLTRPADGATGAAPAPVAAGPNAATRWSSRRMVKRIAVLSGGTSLSYLLLFLASPLLTRLYNQADFAMFAFYQSALAVLSLLLTLQFEQAIPLPRAESEALSLRRLSTRLAAFLAALLTLGCAGFILARGDVLAWLPPLVLISLPFCSLGEAWTRAYRIDAVRQGRFRAMSLSRMALAFGTLSGQIGCAVCGLGGLGMALGDGLGRWLSLLPLVISGWFTRQEVAAALPSEPVIPLHSAAPRNMAQLAVEFRRFPILLTPGAVICLLINTVPAFILPGLYGTEFAGQFALANRAVLLPLLVIGQAVTHVYLSDASKIIRERDPSLLRFMWSTVSQMAALGAFLAGLMAIISPIVFPVIFGPQWGPAGWIVPCLAIGGFAQFVGGPVLQVLVLLRRESHALALHLIGALGVAGSFWLSHACQWTGIQATLLYSTSILLLHGLYLWQSFVAAQHHLRELKQEAAEAATFTSHGVAA